MKRLKITSIAWIGSVTLLMTACFNDLDPKSLGSSVLNSTNVYSTPESYKEGLAKLYATFAVSGQQGPSGQPDIAGIDEGFGNYLRQYWNAQELTTDEAVMAWNDATVKDFHWQTWTSNDVFIAAIYSRIMYTVSLSNEFIRVTTGNDNVEIKMYNAEARFLRALAYYHALDLFGNPPFVTEADKPGAFFPKQTTRTELYSYIETELLAIEAELGTPRFEYGRADKGAAWMLLSKLYLKAEVYIGTPKYTDALTQLNKVIASSYSLSPAYKNNFLADNNTSPEIIFPITFDGLHTRTYGGTVYLIHAAIGGSMDPSGTFGVGGGWGGIRTTSTFVNKFTDITGSSDKRAMFHTNGQNLEIIDIGAFTDGYAITKFRNRTSSNAPAPHAHPDFVDTDYPLFRLADAYLMYAEAVLRTGGSSAQAITYVNALRQRAYGNTSGNITTINLDFILDERARELYWEGHRRTDLIRYKKFTGGNYLWPWKGKVQNGTATDTFRDLFPIPAADLSANPTLKQNTGY